MFPHFGCEVANTMYRLLGARIGWRAMCSLPRVHEPDLLVLGHDTEMGADVIAEWGMRLEPFAAVTNHAVLAPGCVVESGAIVGDMTRLDAGGRGTRVQPAGHGEVAGQTATCQPKAKPSLHSPVPVGLPLLPPP